MKVPFPCLINSWNEPVKKVPSIYALKLAGYLSRENDPGKVFAAALFSPNQRKLTIININMKYLFFFLEKLRLIMDYLHQFFGVSLTQTFQGSSTYRAPSSLYKFIIDRLTVFDLCLITKLNVSLLSYFKREHIRLKTKRTWTWQCYRSRDDHGFEKVFMSTSVCHHMMRNIPSTVWNQAEMLKHCRWNQVFILW